MISSTANPTIKRVRRLRKRRERERLRQALLEGHRTVRGAIAAGARLREVFVTRRASHPRAELVRAGRAAGADAFEVSPAVMAHLTSETTAPDMLAVAPIVDTLLDDVVMPSSGVLLSGVHDPATAGAIIALAEAAGVGAVIEGAKTVDVWSPKVLRAAQGAHYHLRLVRGADDKTVIDRFRSGGARIIALTEGGAAPWALDLTGPVLFVVDPGPSGVDCDERVAVPAGVVAPSLGAQAAVVFYERTRQESPR